MEHNYNKKPRLDNYSSLSSTFTTQNPHDDGQRANINTTALPFSTVITNLGRQTKNHQLSDKKFIVYDLKGKHTKK
jgi:hypothetical protein